MLLALGGLLAWLAWQGEPAVEGGLSGESAVEAGAAGDGVAALDPAAVAQPSADQPEAPAPAGPGAPAALKTIDPATVENSNPLHIAVIEAASGRLIPGAVITIAPPEGVSHPNWREHRAGVADATGHFNAVRWQGLLKTTRKHTPGFQPLILASVPGYGTSDWEPLPEFGAANFQLRVIAGGAVSGVVRDRAGRNPIGGVVVRALRSAEPARGWTFTGLQAVTGPDGRYRIAGLPPRRTLRTVVQASERAEPLDLPALHRLKPADALRAGNALRFEGAGGRGVLDLEAYAHRGTRVIFELQVAEGVAWPESVVMTHGFTFHRASEADRNGASVRVSGSRERSTIVYRDGQAIITREQDHTVTPDPEQRTVELFLPAGTNHVVFHTETLASELWRHEAAADGPTLRVARTLRPKPAVVVQLTGEDGAPLARKDVEVEITAYRGAAAGTEAGAPLGSAVTGEDGRATVTHLLRPVGTGDDVKLGFRPSGRHLYHTGAWSESATEARLLSGAAMAALLRNAKPGEPVVITVPALPTRPVTLRVVDARGRPLSGVEVTAKPASRFRTATARSNPEGLVTFDYVGEPRDDEYGDAEDVDPDNPAAGKIRRNAFGAKIGDAHFEDPVFVVEHNGLRGRLDLYDVAEHAPLSPEEYREQRAEIEEMYAEVARDADPGDEEWRADRDEELRYLEAEADRYARLTATGMRTIRLECVDGDGRPWRGLQLEVRSHSEFDVEEPETPPTTDEHGGVALPVPLDTDGLTVRGKQGEAMQTYRGRVELQADTDTYRVVLYRAKQAELEVRWPEGADAERLMRQTTWSIHDAATGKRLDVQGPMLRQGQGQLLLPMRRLRLEVATRNGVYKGTVAIDVAAGGRSVLEMRAVAEMIRVRMVILAPNGTPATGRYWLYAAAASGHVFNWHGTLDAEGAFETQLTPGRYPTLWARAYSGRNNEVAVLRNVTLPSPAPITLQLVKR